MVETVKLIPNPDSLSKCIPVFYANDILVGSNKLRGLPASLSDQLCLAELREGKGDSIAIMDSTCDTQGNIGHLSVYEQLLPDDMQLLMLPATHTVNSNKDFINQSIQASNVVLLAGGEHLGYNFTGQQLISETAERFGKENPIRDQLDKQMLEKSLFDPTKFTLGICRGFQAIVNALTGIVPAELANYHTPNPGDKNFAYHPVMNALANYFPNEIYPGFSTITSTSSFHAQGFPMRIIAPALDYLSYLGWYPLFIDSTPGVPMEERALEGLVRINTYGEITGLAYQGHFERDNTLDGQAIRQTTKYYIKKFLYRN